MLAWFDPQKKMYCENPIHEQLEVDNRIAIFCI